jgi:NAD-dependent deacetylase
MGDVTNFGHQYRPDIVWFEEPVPMIEKAIEIAQEAEIFVVVGTSLQVYPAAGLVQYEPDGARKLIIDKKVPYVSSVPNVEKIEAPATEGVKKLRELLVSH